MSIDAATTALHYARLGFARQLIAVCDNEIKRNNNTSYFSFWKALGLAREGNYSGAIRECESLKADKDVEYAAIAAALRYHKMSNVEDPTAIGDLEVELQVAESSATPHSRILLATLRSLQGSTREARKLVESVLLSTPDNVEALEALGWIDASINYSFGSNGSGGPVLPTSPRDLSTIQGSIQHFEKALAALESQAAPVSSSAGVLLGLAFAQERSGLSSEAFATLARVRAVHASFWPAAIAQARLHLRISEFSQCEEVLNTVTAQEDLEAEQLRLLLLLLREGAAPAARTQSAHYCALLLRLEPRASNLQVSSSRLLLRLSQQDSALLHQSLQLSEAAARSAPGLAAAHVERARARLLLGDYVAAADAFKEASAADESCAEAVAGLIEAQLGLGEVADAAAQLEVFRLVIESIGKSPAFLALEAKVSLASDPETGRTRSKELLLEAAAHHCRVLDKVRSAFAKAESGDFLYPPLHTSANSVSALSSLPSTLSALLQSPGSSARDVAPLWPLGADPVEYFLLLDPPLIAQVAQDLLLAPSFLTEFVPVSTTVTTVVGDSLAGQSPSDSVLLVEHSSREDAAALKEERSAESWSEAAAAAVVGGAKGSPLVDCAVRHMWVDLQSSSAVLAAVISLSAQLVVSQPGCAVAWALLLQLLGLSLRLHPADASEAGTLVGPLVARLLRLQESLDAPDAALSAAHALLEFFSPADITLQSSVHSGGGSAGFGELLSAVLRAAERAALSVRAHVVYVRASAEFALLSARAQDARDAMEALLAGPGLLLARPTPNGYCLPSGERARILRMLAVARAALRDADGARAAIVLARAELNRDVSPAAAQAGASTQAREATAARLLRLDLCSAALEAALGFPSAAADEVEALLFPGRTEADKIPLFQCLIALAEGAGDAARAARARARLAESLGVSLGESASNLVRLGGARVAQGAADDALPLLARARELLAHELVAQHPPLPLARARIAAVELRVAEAQQRALDAAGARKTLLDALKACFHAATSSSLTLTSTNINSGSEVTEEDYDLDLNIAGDGASLEACLCGLALQCALAEVLARSRRPRDAAEMLARAEARALAALEAHAQNAPAFPAVGTLLLAGAYCAVARLSSSLGESLQPLRLSTLEAARSLALKTFEFVGPEGGLGPLGAGLLHLLWSPERASELQSLSRASQLLSPSGELCLPFLHSKGLEMEAESSASNGSVASSMIGAVPLVVQTWLQRPEDALRPAAALLLGVGGRAFLAHLVADAHVRLAAFLESAGTPTTSTGDNAISLLESALELDPLHPRALARLSEASAQRGADAEARQLATRLLRLSPSSFVTPAATERPGSSGSTALTSGVTPLSMLQLLSVGLLKSRLPSGEDLATCASVVSTVDARSEDPDALSQLLEAQLRRDPLDSRSLLRLVQHRRREGNPEAAEPFLRLCESAPGYSPADGLFRVARASLLRSSGDLAAAIRLLNAARATSDAGLLAAEEMVLLYCTPDSEPMWGVVPEGPEGAPNEADHTTVRLIARIIREVPSSLRGAASASSPAAAVAENTGGISRLEVLTLFAALSPAARRVNPGGVAAALEQLQAAAAQVGPDNPNTVHVLFALAVALYLSGEVPKARTQLKALLRLPFNADCSDVTVMAWEMLADLNQQAGKGELAKEALSRALQIDKSNARVYEAMGNLSEMDSNWQDAAELYYKAWECENEQSATVGYKLAYNLLRAHRFFEAIEICRKVLKVYPDYPQIKEDILYVAQSCIRP